MWLINETLISITLYEKAGSLRSFFLNPGNKKDNCKNLYEISKHLLTVQDTIKVFFFISTYIESITK